MHPDFNDDEPEIKVEAQAILPEELTKEHWIQHGRDFVQRQLNKVPNIKKAKNIILFIGDGMGHTTVGK
jgi:alkaline phosphatase